MAAKEHGLPKLLLRSGGREQDLKSFGLFGDTFDRTKDTFNKMLEDARKTFEDNLNLSNETDECRNVVSYVHSDDVVTMQKVLEGASNKLEMTCNSGEDNSFPSTSKFKEFKPPKNWVNAPEFVPRQFKAPDESPAFSRSYAEVAGVSAENNVLPVAGASGSDEVDEMNLRRLFHTNTQLCPYAMVGECRYGEQCLFVHGSACDLCGQACLHPFNRAQRDKHHRECVEQHERDMELSFAVARSNDKTCGVCMEVVMDKNPPGEQRFGILPSCSHCFCLSCIRRWRQARQFENKIIRACPECRVTSDFVCPSRFWVETKEEKEKLLDSYKIALSKKACRYYRSGGGMCPFGNKCFYLHALPNGQKVDVGPPRRKPRRQGMAGAAETQAASIWEFLEEWELQWMDIEDFMEMFDSDETSEWSDPDDHDEMPSDLEDWDRI